MAQLREEVRLDADVHRFSRVTRLYVSPRGEIVVPQLQDYHIRVFGEDGRPAGTVGRRGSGPGEFNFVLSIGWKLDTMWVDDIYQRRLTFISPDQKTLRTVSYPRVTLAGQTLPVSTRAMRPDGTTIGAAIVPPRNARPNRDIKLDKAVVVSVSPEGVARILLEQPNMYDRRWYMESTGYGSTIPFTFRPQTVVSRSGDRIAHMTSAARSSSAGEFTVSVFNQTGDTLFVRSYPYRPVPVSAAARDSALAALLPRPVAAREGPPDLALRFQELARKLMPESFAGVQFILLGLDNTVWIGLNPEPSGQPVLVLNKFGDSVGTVMIPKGSVLRQATIHNIWVISTDGDGLSSVVRYGVSGINCGRVECR